MELTFKRADIKCPPFFVYLCDLCSNMSIADKGGHSPGGSFGRWKNRQAMIKKFLNEQVFVTLEGETDNRFLMFFDQVRQGTRLIIK